MDPNETLKQLRELIQVPQYGPSLTAFDRAERFDLLVDYIEALDGWLSKGGFLPDAWCNGGPRL
jgi:hypothetical protein